MFRSDVAYDSNALMDEIALDTLGITNKLFDLTDVIYLRINTAYNKYYYSTNGPSLLHSNNYQRLARMYVRWKKEVKRIGFALSGIW